MLCELCGCNSYLIHVTSKNGFICNKCWLKLENSKEGKLRRQKEKEIMYKKYGLLDKNGEVCDQCRKQILW